MAMTQSSSTPEGFEAIEGLDLSHHVAAALAAEGITVPTAVQAEAIPPILAGRAGVIYSATGTGKTLAYLLPILQRLRSGEHKAVVIAPATELALQILRVADRYKDPSISTGALVATASHKQQRARVQKSTRLIVGTLGRVMEMYRQRKLKGVTMMVLDEPDPILASKDADYLREVLSRPEPKVQLVLAAATLGPRAEALAQERASDFRTQPTEDPLRTHIKHGFVQVPAGGPKDVQLARFIEAHRTRRAMVFINQPHLLRHLYRYLGEHRLKPVSVSEDLSKQDRKAAMESFSAGKARVLLTTDAAARGLDIAGVEWVLHYELPRSAQAYVHRAGRTGRAGALGHSVLFVEPKERGALKRLGKELNLRFEPMRR